MRMICLLICTVIYYFSFSQPRKINAESSIQEVTIFSSGAQIQRNATVVIQPGKSEIVFTGLSNQLRQQSIQLKADADITLLSVQAIKDYLSQRKVEQDERLLLNRKSDLSNKYDSDTRILQVFKNEEQMLIKNEEIGGQNGVKTEELKQAFPNWSLSSTFAMSIIFPFASIAGKLSILNSPLACPVESVV